MRKKIIENIVKLDYKQVIKLNYNQIGEKKYENVEKKALYHISVNESLS